MPTYQFTTSGQIITHDVISKGTLIPFGNLALWSDAELAKYSIARVPDVPPPVPPEVVLTRTYKADIWRRSTDTEATVIDAALAGQPVRLRRLWDDALWLDTSDELYPTLLGAFTEAFGAERAEELLQPTE